MTFRMPVYVGNADQRTIPTMSGMAQPRGCMPSACSHRTHTVRAMPRVSTYSGPSISRRIFSNCDRLDRPRTSFFSALFSGPRVYTSPVIVNDDEFCETITLALFALAAITAFFARLLIIRY